MSENIKQTHDVTAVGNVYGPGLAIDVHAPMWRDKFVGIGIAGDPLNTTYFTTPAQLAAYMTVIYLRGCEAFKKEELEELLVRSLRDHGSKIDYPIPTALKGLINEE